MRAYKPPEEEQQQLRIAATEVMADFLPSFRLQEELLEEHDGEAVPLLDCLVFLRESRDDLGAAG